MRLVPAATVAALCLAAHPAHAGWTAVQHHFDPAGKELGTSRMTYGHHKLRIDSQGRTMVIDLRTGSMSIIDPSSKSYSTITVQQMVAMRERMRSQLEQQMDQLPPEMRAELQKQLDVQEAAVKTSLKAKKTGRTDTVHGVKCTVYTWNRPEGPGEACIASQLAADVGQFREDLVAFSQKMAQLSAGGVTESMAFLQLGEYGFPVRTKQRVDLGPKSMELVATFSDIENRSVAPSFFDPPAGFTERSAEEIMRAMTGGAGPGASPF
jgi:hypothetical protein